MVGLLDLAATGACEAALADRLDIVLDAGHMPDLASLKQVFGPQTAPILDVTIPLADLATYDPLLPSQAAARYDGATGLGQ